MASAGYAALTHPTSVTDSAGAQRSIKQRTQFGWVIDHGIRAPVIGIVIAMNITVANSGGTGASRTARLDVAQVVADKGYLKI